MRARRPANPLADLRGEVVVIEAFQLRGTPSLVVIDRAGRIRLNAFGQIDDLAVGAALARLIDEPRSELEADCDPDIGCPAPTPGMQTLAEGGGLVLKL